MVVSPDHLDTLGAHSGSGSPDSRSETSLTPSTLKEPRPTMATNLMTMIEEKRQALHDLASRATGGLQDPAVLAASAELDQLILMAQRSLAPGRRVRHLTLITRQYRPHQT